MSSARANNATAAQISPLTAVATSAQGCRETKRNNFVSTPTKDNSIFELRETCSKLNNHETNFVAPSRKFRKEAKHAVLTLMCMFAVGIDQLRAF
jgi:hypothetical protein